MKESTADEFETYFGYYPNSSKCRIDSGRILVLPLLYRKKIVNLQIISENGAKSFLRGARKSHCYWTTPRADNTRIVAIGEGVATILSVVQHTEEQVLGIASMDAGNLPKVAEEMRKQFSNATILIFGDNDRNGVGQKATQEALQRISGKCGHAIPEFTEDEVQQFHSITGSQSDPTDWNDYYLIHNGGNNA